MTEIPAKVREFLSKPNFAVLATIGRRSGRPQAVPMWFMLDDGQILMNTRRGGKKLGNIRANRQVALTVIDRDNPYQYVQIRGRVVRLDPKTGARDIDRLSQRYRGAPFSYPAGGKPEDRISIVIEPEDVISNLR